MMYFMEEILKKLWNKEISVKEAMEQLKYFPYKKIGDAKIDFYRNEFKKIPEAIYAEGKSIEDIRKIAREMMEKGKVFITKASEEIYKNLAIKKARYYREANMIVIGERKKKNGGYIAIVSGGLSDKPIAEEAAITAYELGNDIHRIYDVGGAALHRIIDYAEEIGKANVTIAVAGMDGILPTIVSNFTSSPIIALPTSIGYGTGLNGVAALMAMLNSCSPGIAVVNIDNGFGAGVIAHLINRNKND